MAWRLPRALRLLGARLCHTQHALPLGARCPCVVTVHDVSFARDPDVMGWKDRTTAKWPHTTSPLAMISLGSKR
jgi:hypothetical protein